MATTLSAADSPALSGEALLRRIGDDLDCGIFPVVHNGGRVGLGAAVANTSPGHGAQNERRRREEGSRLEPPAPRQRAWGRQGSSPASATTQVVRNGGLTEDEETDLDGASVSYPNMRVRLAPTGIVLSGALCPIRGISRCASLAVYLPLVRETRVRAWAWWTDGVWIGPRHTNYGDGSICAFEPSDATWNRGRPVVQLIDIYAVWIARHMYLERFGRWPGNQVLHTVHERLSESHPDEWCGCGSTKSYSQCCYETDRGRSLELIRQEFVGRYGNNSVRRPVVPVF
jgi:hypothetical protein